MGSCSMLFAFDFRTIRGSLTMSLQSPFSKLMYLLINKSMECECSPDYLDLKIIKTPVVKHFGGFFYV